MAEVKWIKLVTEFFDDEKIKLIESMPEADMVLIIWVKLLTLAGKKNMSGYIFLTENIPYTDEMLSTLFNRPVNTIRLALETFKGFGMISYNGNGEIKISNWDKHQNIDGLDRIKELAKARQGKYIKRKKQKALMSADVSTTSNDDTRLDIRLDKIREDKKENTKKDNKEVPITIFKEEEEKENTLLINNEEKEKKKTNNIEFDFELWSWHGIDDDIMDRWTKIFPGVEVSLELVKMREFFKKHPDHEKVIEQKFKNNFAIYIFNWLERAGR